MLASALVDKLEDHIVYSSRMGKRIVLGLLGAVVGYLIGAFGGGYLVSVLSSNVHDRDLEAAMTGAFVTGPLAAVVGAVVGAWRAKPAAPPTGVVGPQP